MRVSTVEAAYRRGHRAGNRFFNQLVARLFGSGFTDILSGYRVMSRRFAKSFPAASSGFEIETELSVHALDLKLVTVEIPLVYGERPENSKSKLRTYRDGLRILAKIVMMYRALKPLQFYGIIAFGLMLLSILIGTPVLDRVRRIPDLCRGCRPRCWPRPSCSSASSAWPCGIITDAVGANRRELKRMQYLQLSAPARSRPPQPSEQPGETSEHRASWLTRNTTRPAAPALARRAHHRAGARPHLRRFHRPSASRAGDDTILDVGVSDVVNDAANMMERKYPFAELITAVGLGSGEDFRAAYPQTAYKQIAANQRLPFADRQFDIATSNAVLEHVGSPAHQELFVHELIRVARKVFISVPNRYFPVEHHTAIPFLHYSDAGLPFGVSAPRQEGVDRSCKSHPHVAQAPREARARRHQSRDGLHGPEARPVQLEPLPVCRSIGRRLRLLRGEGLDLPMRSDNSRDRLLLLVASLALMLPVLRFYWPAGGGLDVVGYPLGRDFINVWSGPQVAFGNKVSALFDLRGYHEAIGRLFGTPLPFHNWGYPLFTLPAFWPLAQLPYFWALTIWTAGLFAMFAAIVLGEVEPARRRQALLLLALTPACLINTHRRPERLPERGLVPGRRAQHRSAADPVRRTDRSADVQAASRHPAAVRAGRARRLARHRRRRRHGTRAGRASAPSYLDVDAWRDYFAVVGPYQGELLQPVRRLLHHMMVSVLASARQLGVSYPVALGLQVVVSICASRWPPGPCARIADPCARAFVLATATLAGHPLCLQLRHDGAGGGAGVDHGRTPAVSPRGRIRSTSWPGWLLRRP